MKTRPSSSLSYINPSSLLSFLFLALVSFQWPVIHWGSGLGRNRERPCFNQNKRDPSPQSFLGFFLLMLWYGPFGRESISEMSLWCRPELSLVVSGPGSPATPHWLSDMRCVHSIHVVDSNEWVEFGESSCWQAEGQNLSNNPSYVPHVSSCCPHLTNAALA